MISTCFIVLKWFFVQATVSQLQQMQILKWNRWRNDSTGDSSSFCGSTRNWLEKTLCCKLHIEMVFLLYASSYDFAAPEIKFLLYKVVRFKWLKLKIFRADYYVLFGEARHRPRDDMVLGYLMFRFVTWDYLCYFSAPI